MYAMLKIYNDLYPWENRTIWTPEYLFLKIIEWVIDKTTEILEYNNLASFPITWRIWKLYLDKATNSIYRWDWIWYSQVSWATSSPVENYIKDFLTTDWVNWQIIIPRAEHLFTQFDTETYEISWWITIENSNIPVFINESTWETIIDIWPTTTPFDWKIVFTKLA